MSKKQTKTVIKPVYELGDIVFTVNTLEKAAVFERIYREATNQESAWGYRLTVGNNEEGQPIVTQDIFAAEQLCLQAEAKEILKEKEELVG